MHNHGSRSIFEEAFQPYEHITRSKCSLPFVKSISAFVNIWYLLTYVVISLSVMYPIAPYFTTLSSYQQTKTNFNINWVWLFSKYNSHFLKIKSTCNASFVVVSSQLNLVRYGFYDKRKRSSRTQNQFTQLFLPRTRCRKHDAHLYYCYVFCRQNYQLPLCRSANQHHLFSQFIHVMFVLTISYLPSGAFFRVNLPACQLIFLFAHQYVFILKIYWSFLIMPIESQKP